MAQLPSTGEFGFVSWLRNRTRSDPRVLIGPGDDCAVLAPSARPLLITTDMLMDGTDFILAEVGPRRAGRKAMAANLSDLAAMAGQPTAAVVSVALPRGDRSQGSGVRSQESVGTGVRSQESGDLSSLSPEGAAVKSRGHEPRHLAEELYLGVRDVADEFGVSIVGGDTNSWAGPLVISITALGEATGRGPATRGGARPGDWVFVTGPLGGSILGRHLDFTPRVREALALHAAVELRAMIDVSDGLAGDLSHVLVESGCGAVLFADSIPISSAARQLSLTSGKTPLQHALGDGEDFELIFTVSPTDGEKLLRDPPVVGLVKIGECIAEGLWIEERGERKSLAPTGWVHAM